MGMKRFFSLGLIATVLAAFSFTSCTNDDDESGNIVGKWKIVSITTESGDSAVIIYEGQELETEIWEFRSDGTCIYTSEFEGEKSIDNATYTINGNYIYITYLDGVVEKKIFSISGNNLVLYQDGYYDAIKDETYETKPADGGGYVYIKLTIKYERML